MNWQKHASTSVSPAELEELNGALHILADVFPNIRPEVFREMLTTLSRESRAHVVAEHLLRNPDKWVGGRWRLQPECRVESSYAVPLGDVRATTKKARLGVGGRLFGKREREGEAERVEQEERGKEPREHRHGDHLPPKQGSALVPKEETFRTPSYKASVYSALRSEFRALSKSTINAVLAEHNHCYTLSRPVLAALAARTWRASLGNMVTRAFGFALGRGNDAGKDATLTKDSHYMIHWAPGPTDNKLMSTPKLRHTGNSELDEELRLVVLEPILQRRRERDDRISLELAELLNEQEAELAGATFECSVCLADVSFERLASCSGPNETHLVCFGCVYTAASYAVYGQNWAVTIDHDRGQMACIAPSAATPCSGCIPEALAHRAILAGKGGDRLWELLQGRLRDEALRRSGVKTVVCPFCSYAEVDSIYLPSSPVWSVSWKRPFRTLSTLLLTLDLLVFASLLALLFYALVYVILYFVLSTSCSPSAVSVCLCSTWRSSLRANIRRTQLSRRFQCRSPQCLRTSCIDCRKLWTDPHRCHESAILSLRTTVEAARTAALKRTCPRCSLSFVKSSGCNKMVCVCGYAMCYVCRQGLNGGPSGNNNNNAQNADGNENGEGGQGEGGYRHFCQHFRPSGGRCVECDRCDLYRSEDEDEAVRRAGELAEREWRARNGIDQNSRLLLAGDSRNSFASASGGDSTSFSSATSSIAPSAFTLGKVRTGLANLSLQNLLDWWVATVLVCRLDSNSQS